MSGLCVGSEFTGAQKGGCGELGVGKDLTGIDFQSLDVKTVLEICCCLNILHSLGSYSGKLCYTFVFTKVLKNTIIPLNTHPHNSSHVVNRY